MKILLTGGAGFVGFHLSRALSARGHEVYIADRFAAQDLDRTHLAVYLENAESIAAAVESVRPECIIHLAAQSSVSASWKDPESTLETNIIGSVRLFQTMIRIVPDCRFVFIGSGEEYGTNCSENQMFTEESECRPATSMPSASFPPVRSWNFWPSDIPQGWSISVRLTSSVRGSGKVL